MIPNNAGPLRITAAAGTELAGASSGGTVNREDCSPSRHSSLSTGVYNPKTFVLHAASLRQAFAHCAIFLTAASRRSLDRVSVPVWLIILSDQLLIAGLVGFYSANYLIRRRLISRRIAALIRGPHAVLAEVSLSYPPPRGR